MYEPVFEVVIAAPGNPILRRAGLPPVKDRPDYLSYEPSTSVPAGTLDPAKVVSRDEVTPGASGAHSLV